MNNHGNRREALVAVVLFSVGEIKHSWCCSVSNWWMSKWERNKGVRQEVSGRAKWEKTGRCFLKALPPNANFLGIVTRGKNNDPPGDSSVIQIAPKQWEVMAGWCYLNAEVKKSHPTLKDVCLGWVKVISAFGGRYGYPFFFSPKNENRLTLQFCQHITHPT